MYRKHSEEIRTTKILTITVWIYVEVMSQMYKSADELANSVDPDQTAPIGAVWSGLHFLLSLIYPNI